MVLLYTKILFCNFQTWNTSSIIAFFSSYTNLSYCTSSSVFWKIIIYFSHCSFDGIHHLKHKMRKEKYWCMFLRDPHFHLLSTTPPMWTYITTYNAPYLSIYSSGSTSRGPFVSQNTILLIRTPIFECPELVTCLTSHLWKQRGNKRRVSSAWAAQVDETHTLARQGSVRPALDWWFSALTKTELFLPRRMNMQHTTTWKQSYFRIWNVNNLKGHFKIKCQ